jgi:hypothetical protein
MPQTSLSSVALTSTSNCVPSAAAIGLSRSCGTVVKVKRG